MLFTPNFVRHEQKYLTQEAKTKDINKLNGDRSQFSNVENIQTEPLVIMVKGNKVYLRWSADIKRLPSADVTDTPEYMNFEGVTISRFEDGKIAEQWVYYDSHLGLALTSFYYKNHSTLARAHPDPDES